MTLAFDKHLLPSNATLAEKALATALDKRDDLSPGIDAIASWRFARPLPSGFGPWLVDEYQLGTIRQFFDSDEACIDAGWPWLQIRGTVQAVEDALGWTGYQAAEVEAPNVRRTMWHRYQIAMGELPLTPEGVPAEDPRLVHAEYLASLSDPARALFWRGFHGYDVRAMEWSRSRWGSAIWGNSSGVRLPDGKTRWSHGRDHGPFEATASATTQAALGIDTLAAGTIDWSSQLTWAEVGHLGWGDPTPAQIAELVSGIVSKLSIYVGFFDASGDLIGARRAIERKEADTFAGAAVPDDQTVLHITCRTGFGDGFGSEATTAAVLFGVQSANGPGELWVAPDDLQPPDGQSLADVTVGNWIISDAPDQGPTAPPLTFTQTIREHFTMRVRLL